MNAPPLWLLTGPSGTGKTTFCRRLGSHARGLGWDVAGLLSPAWMKNGHKIGILAEDLHSGEQHPIAYATPHPQADFQIGQWHFDERVLQWGNQVIENSVPCDLLIVDELGPLEFETGGGLTAAFTVIAAGNYRVGCVVVRLSLLAQAHARWPWAHVLPIEEAILQMIIPA